MNEHTFRTTTMRYGGIDYIGLNREVRDAADVTDGETLEVVMTSDDEPRTVEIPAELLDALAAARDARTTFEALSYTHRKEYAGWVAEGKREETRLRRSERAIEMLREGIRTPDAPR